MSALKPGRLLAVALLLLLPGGASSATPNPASTPTPALHILFIGNSLTYTNDLPAIVRALAQAAGAPPPVTRSIVAGGASLEDHWRKGEARQAIREGPWDFVVLQQGPSAAPESRMLLLQYARLFATEIRNAGATPVLYMVWPSNDRRQDFRGVSDSYRLAAKEVGGILCPVGEAWQDAWKRDPKLELYSADGVHPTPAGSYLAGLVLYAWLYGKSPIGLPGELVLTSGVRFQIPGETVKALQQAAAQSLE